LGNEYRAYALDFWGFGESEKQREQFQIEDFVDLVDEFMERLGIASAPLVGHSMGGTVSMSVAIKHPQRAEKVIVVGSPVDGRSLSLLLKLAGNPVIANVVWHAPALFRAGMRLFAPFVSRNNWRTFYELIVEDTSDTTLESFFHSIASLRQTDLRKELSKIGVPALGVYGARDVIVSPKQHAVFDAGIPNSNVFYMPGSGHFPMLDEPESFNQHLRAFLQA
jgi:pimeloyl-ACP methyl ester carboxylesterase